MIRTVAPLRSRQQVILFHVLDPQEIQAARIHADGRSGGGVKMEVSPDYATHEYNRR